MSDKTERFIKAYDGKLICFAGHIDENRYGNVKQTKYKGPLVEVLAKVSSNHHYGVDLEEMAEVLGRNVTATDLINELDDINGDGCDYIIYLETNGVKLELGVVDEDDEDEWEEC